MNKLKTKWSVEASQDILSFHNLAAEQEIVIKWTEMTCEHCEHNFSKTCTVNYDDSSLNRPCGYWVRMKKPLDRLTERVNETRQSKQEG